MLRGYEAIPELLRRAEIDTVFAMMAATNAPWIGQGVESGALRLIRTRHEETAVGAAAGYARASGRLGLCSVQRGPGFANSVNGLIAAARSHAPVLMIVAESPATGGRTAQNIDQRALAGAIDVGFHHVRTAGELEAGFWQATREVRWDGRPQVLSLADGVLDDAVALEMPPPNDLASSVAPTGADVAAVVDALAAARSPLILAGQGAVLAGCRAELEELADLTGARVANTLAANWFFDGHPANLGLCGGWSPPPVRACIDEVDVVVAFGASLNSYTTDNQRIFAGATVIRCDIVGDAPPYAESYPADFLVRADARATATAVAAEWRRRGLPPRPRPSVPDVAHWQDSLLDIDLGHDPDRGLDLRLVYRRLDEMLDEDRVVVTDSGRCIGTLPTLLTARNAQSWLYGRGHSSLGLGLGNAVGAAAACPDRQVVLVCGDGGFMMASQDIDAFRLNALRVLVVIMNDEQYGSEVKWLDRYGLPADTVRQSMPDVPTLAVAFGGTGVVVESLEDLERADLNADLVLLDVRIDPYVGGRSVYSTG